jgi:hypothetical protein
MFYQDIRQWRTPEDLADHLRVYDPQICSWVQGVTLHHTYRPLACQWEGLSTVRGIRDYYRTERAWDRGPHLFLVDGAPRPDLDGIYQLTPLNIAGIHAGPCNDHFWGLELVGDFDAVSWSDSLETLLFETLKTLFVWRGITTISSVTIKGHRECLPNKTCPGSAIQMDTVRQRFQAYMARSDDQEDTPVLGPATITAAQAAQTLLAHLGSDYTPFDIRTVMVPTYMTLCAQVGMDPAVPIAQLFAETMYAEKVLHSFWAQRPQRNPAGIGVTGVSIPNVGVFNTQRSRWEDGVSFPSWNNHAIPAHIGRLLAYAIHDREATPAQQQLIIQAQRCRAIPAHVRGIASTIAGLSGTWAVPGHTMFPDGSLHTYSDRLMTFIREIRQA